MHLVLLCFEILLECYNILSVYSKYYQLINIFNVYKAIVLEAVITPMF